MRVLYIHGLESGPFGRKAKIITQCTSIKVLVPHMKHPYNIWSSMNIIIDAIYDFQPEIVVASSYGTIIILLLIQFGVWSGPTILLSTAMGLLNHRRLYLPNQVNSSNGKIPIMCVHGTRDTLCNINDVRTLVKSKDCLISLDDDHRLNSICESNKESTLNASAPAFEVTFLQNSKNSDNPPLIQYIHDISPHIGKNNIKKVSKITITAKLTYVVVESLILWIPRIIRIYIRNI